ncbi:MAG TPA: hypothetical protein VKH42_10425 [Vicinamibacterales bacterium]|nr:hypothetical protein [Vicinamibacterales bacterium]
MTIDDYVVETLMADLIGHDRLVKRRLIGIERERITAIPVYTVMRPWRRQ